MNTPRGRRDRGPLAQPSLAGSQWSASSWVRLAQAVLGWLALTGDKRVDCSFGGKFFEATPSFANCHRHACADQG